jgi:hypothetical protein
MGTGFLFLDKSGRGVALVTHLYLAQRLKKEQSFTFTPHLDLVKIKLALSTP